MKSFRLSLLAAGLVACAACVAFPAQAQLKPKAAAPAATPAPDAAPAGVVANPEFEKAGQVAAQAWLLLLDRRDWGTAWDASSGMFRQTVPLPMWMDNIPKVREPFGAMVERTPANAVYRTVLPGRPDGDYVTSLFNTKFSNKPDVVETVTAVREPDGRWRVTGYQAQ